MNHENKNCIQCKKDFVIKNDDLIFYQKFGVPTPKMCPLCRAQRRLAFRNERAFFKRPCDKCKKDLVSMYNPNKSHTVWCYDCWFSDSWDARNYGRDYDFSKSFFEQFAELWKVVPKIALIHVRSVNSDYINVSADNKNCYMIIESSNNEGCTHCYWIQQCKDCVDVSFAHQTELSYESDDCYNSYRLFYSKGCHDSHDSYFLLDCRDCSDCVGCINLRHKQYHVFNQPLSKEAYENFKKEAGFDTYSGIESLRKKFYEFLKTQPRKFSEILNAPGSTGNYMKDAKNCLSCFHCYDSEDSKYGVHVWRNAKDCMDVDTAGRNAEKVYNSMNAGIDVSNQICSILCWTSGFMEYSYYCFDSNNCFGSVGLRNQNYCILNKQYTKEEYEILRNKIVVDMKKREEYGEFFPAKLSAFGYNETAAQEQFPLSKDEALTQSFNWEEYPRGTYGKETIDWKNIPDSIHEIGDIDILNQIFACVSCRKNYRIISNEFGFYKNLNIPLPRLCPDCRHIRRFTARGPNRLWKRACRCGGETAEGGNYKNTANHFHGSQHCLNEFETPYEPGREELIYCEKCFNSEII